MARFVNEWMVFLKESYSAIAALLIVHGATLYFSSLTPYPIAIFFLVTFIFLICALKQNFASIDALREAQAGSDIVDSQQK